MFLNIYTSNRQRCNKSKHFPVKSYLIFIPIQTSFLVSLGRECKNEIRPRRNAGSALQLPIRSEEV